MTLTAQQGMATLRHSTKSHREQPTRHRQSKRLRHQEMNRTCEDTTVSFERNEPDNTDDTDRDTSASQTDENDMSKHTTRFEAPVGLSDEDFEEVVEGGVGVRVELQVRDQPALQQLASGVSIG